MTEVEVRLNKNKPFSENRGDMGPEDPHYQVAFWQGETIKCTDKRSGKPVRKMVLLPFDANGELVPDDGKTAPWEVLLPHGPNGTLVKATNYPLWNDDMRALLEKKKKEAADKIEGEDEETDIAWASGRINWVGLLTGSEKYKWEVIQEGGKKKFGFVFISKKNVVEYLVKEKKIVSPDRLSSEWAAVWSQLPGTAGAAAA